jgi:hypothetical protein
MFNGNNLSFVQINDNTNSLHMLSNVLADNTLMFTSSSLQNYVNTPISVRFQSNNGTVNSSDLTSSLAYLNGEVAAVEVATGVEELSNDAQGINVYPNPATNLLNIEVSENSAIQLLDLNGKQIIVSAKANANQKLELNIQNVAGGIYILKATNDKFSVMKKVVISK